MYTVDGLAPEGNGWLLFLTGSGIRGVSARRASMVELPGMDGVLPDYGAPFMPATLPLRYRIDGASHAEFMAVVEMMNGVFGQRRKLLRVVHQYGPGVSRVNDALVVEATPPEPLTEMYATYQVTLTFPEPFWRSASTITTDPTTITGSLVTYIMPEFFGTGPVNDALIRVKGGFASATVMDAITGDQISIDTPVADTEYVVIDCKAWTAKRVTTDTWTGGTDISSLVNSNRGQGPMLTLEPDLVATGGRYRLQARAINPTGVPTVQIRARQSYH